MNHTPLQQRAAEGATAGLGPPPGWGAMVVAGLVPPIAYFLAHQLWGIGPAVVVGVGVSVAGLGFEHRVSGRTRGGWLGLLAVSFGGGLALITGDAKSFFLIAGVLWWAVLGGALLTSVVLRRPIAAVVARFFGMKHRARHLRCYTVITAAFGTAYVLRAVIRGYLMAKGSLGGYVVTQLVTGCPVDVVLVVWALWYLRAHGEAVSNLPVPPDTAQAD